MLRTNQHTRYFSDCIPVFRIACTESVGYSPLVFIGGDLFS
jgi:hypothetical protein